MKPRVILPCMLEERRPDVPVTYVISEVQSDVHVFLPETFPTNLTHHIARNFSHKIQQPVQVFHDHAREKYRCCPVPANTSSEIDTDRYGILVYFCAEDMSKPAATNTSNKSTGYEDGGRIPRPRNSWILFRQRKDKELREVYPRLTASEMSTMIAAMWKDAGADVKNEWQRRAEEEDRLHKRKYPDYQYRARKSSEKKRRARRNIQDQAQEALVDTDTSVSPAEQTSSAVQTEQTESV